MVSKGIIENFLKCQNKSQNIKNLDLFYKSGFPSKQAEDWKFTDLNLILSKNFKSISNEINFESTKELEIIKNFKHNYIFLNNGKIISSSFPFEEKNKISIKDFGKQVPIDSIKGRDLEDVKPGGLGVYFIKKSIYIIVVGIVNQNI